MELKNDFEVSTGVEEAWTVLTDVERIAPCLPGAELREIEGDEYRGVVKVKVGPISAEYRGAAHFVELDAKARRAVLRAEGREARGQGNASATITATLEPSEKGTKVSVVTDLSITGKVAQFGRGVLADVSAKLLGQFVDNLESTVLSEAHPSDAQQHEAQQHETTQDGPVNPAPEPEAAAAAGPPAKAGRISRRRHGAAAEDAGEHADDGAGTKDEKPAVKEEPVHSDPVSRNGSGAARDAAAADQGKDEVADRDGEQEGATVRRLEPRSAEPVDLFEVAGPSLVKRLVPLAGALALVLVVRALLRRRST
jgi:carbon monoxide dehydrogenase subunit G